MIDRAALLSTLKPVVTDLEASIRERAVSTVRIAEHLALQHSKAVKADRTAMSLEEWRDGEITQAAVAWVLGCVFVRFLEDNRLIDDPLLTGPGDRRDAALGQREVHFQQHQEHSDREYLEACFRAVARFPAVAALYDEEHNPLWLLGPTADGARELREAVTAIDPATGELVHDYSDPDLGTRFLGDLYQDLSEAAKKRYALLQTPDFVERFILDRTLTPAIEEFGLAEVRLIDPTCGSGHFLIGALERLFALWREREPATEPAVLAQRCLDHIAGVDLNPFATAIARFRLVVAALRLCEIARLAEAPPFGLHLATGDSLLHGPLPTDGATMLFDAGRMDHNIAHVFETEDAGPLKEILGRGYHAVVGNPPYIRGDDEAARDAYRARYASCRGHFVLTVPFMERFFELAISGTANSSAGFVGKITGNSFMKRSFGKDLVERFLPSRDLTDVIDTAGADIPGHSGIPTVVLVGRSRQPVSSELTVVRSLRSEASVDGVQFWNELEGILRDPERTSEVVALERRARADFSSWPWTLGAQGSALLERLSSAESTLAEVLEDVGRITHTGDDQSFLAALPSAKSRSFVPFVRGDDVRDWSVRVEVAVAFPYNGDDARPLEVLPDELARFFWPRRTHMSRRVDFGKTLAERGMAWFEHSMFFPRRYLRQEAIAFAFMGHVSHFARLPASAVTKQTAPVLLLRAGIDHDGVLGILNSGVVNAYIHSRCQPKPGFTEIWGARFEVSNADLKSIPLPALRSPSLAGAINEVATERGSLLAGLMELSPDADLALALADLHERDVVLTARMISLQEELDWQVLAAYGLVSDALPVLGEEAPAIDLGERAFEIILARNAAAGETQTTWFARHGSTPITEIPTSWPAEYRAVVERRITLIETDPDVGLIERPEHKRRWKISPWEERQRDALTMLVLDALEDGGLWSDLRPRSTAELTDHLRHSPLLVQALELLAERKDADLTATVRRLVLDAAVPHPVTARLTESGLRKRDVWDRTWELQRAEDRGEDVGVIAVPPKYAQADFRSATTWKHRGKLDVPKERFVLLPNAERGADPTPVVGWAGWDERDLARALAGRITELRDQDAANAERLTPLLAGVLELLPWIRQWHPGTDPLFGGSAGAFFDSWLDGQLAEHRLTRDTLRAWRPPAPTRGRRTEATSS